MQSFICGVHGKIEIENISIRRTGKKVCKFCTLSRTKKTRILAKYKVKSEKLIVNEKKCSKCEIIKPIDNFHKSNTQIDGHHTYCKDCQKEYKKEYYSRPGVKIKFSKSCKKTFIKRVYSLSIDEFKILLEKQNNVCKICKQPEKGIDRRSKLIKQLSTDHCHKTGKVRGLLCRNCNQGLGHFKDSIKFLIEAAKYLHEFE